MSYVIGLDLATQFGVSVIDHKGRHIWSASQSIKSFGHRWHGFYARLCEVIESRQNIEPIDIVVIEDVVFKNNAITGHLMGIAMAVCERYGVSYAAVSPSTLKKWATGHGHAKKLAMIAAARERCPGVEIKDDNQADAILLALWGLENCEA